MNTRGKPFQFETCCVNAKGDDIYEMVERSRNITYRTFFKHILLDEVLSIFAGIGYARDSRSGLTLKRDWGVFYAKSRYQGRPCYYLSHSGIEYVFVERGNV